MKTLKTLSGKPKVNISLLGLMFIITLFFTIPIASASVWDGIITYYKFDETAGNNINDSIGRYNATNYGAIPNVEGKLEKGDYNYAIDRETEKWDSWVDWCRKVVWYEHKKGNYIYNYKKM